MGNHQPAFTFISIMPTLRYPDLLQVFFGLKLVFIQMRHNIIGGVCHSYILLYFNAESAVLNRHGDPDEGFDDPIYGEMFPLEECAPKLPFI